MTFERMNNAETDESLRQQERQFVGETMPRVVDFMVQRLGFDVDLLQATGRPMAIECIVPSEVGEYSYSLTIGTDDTEDIPERLTDKGSLLYRFRVTDSEEVLYPALDAMQQAGIIDMLKQSGEAEDTLLALLLDYDRKDELGELTCASESVVQYICDPDELTIRKEVGTNYYLDGERIMAIGVDAEPDTDFDEVPTADADLEQLFASIGDDMASIDGDDLTVMRQILYRLQLPGEPLADDDVV